MSKIVIVLNTSWNVYNFRLNLLRHLEQNGNEIIVIAPKDRYTSKIPFDFYPIHVDSKSKNPFKDFMIFLRLLKYFYILKPDKVLLFTIKPNIYGSLAASILKISFINNISGLGALFINKGISTIIAINLYKLALKNSSRIFFQNYDDMNLFIDRKIVQSDKCMRIPGSGVDIKKFKPAESISVNNVRVFVLIARMLWDKGVREYIEAIKIIKKLNYKAEFKLIGSAEVNNPSAIPLVRIREWENEKLITFLGHVEDVKQEIANVDCVVLPSYREGSPRSLMEAASMAKPIITTNVAGCKDVVNDGVTGYICRVKDSKDLADKIIKILELSEESLIQMGKMGRIKMENEFKESIVIKNYLDIINY